MALNRKEIRTLAGCEELTDEQIKALLDRFHTEIDAVRDERDQIQTQLDAATKERDAATAAKEKAEKDFTDYKTEQENKSTRAAKADAYKALLKEAGIAEKRIAAVVRATDLDGIELNKDGTIKGAKELTESVKTEWADFIPEVKQEGAKVETPPPGDKGKAAFEAMTLSEKMAFANDHPAEFAEYMK